MSWMKQCFLCLLAMFLAPDLHARLSVSLEPLENGQWGISYALSEPVSALVFARGNGDYRADTWQLEEGFVLERFGETDRIRKLNDAPFQQFKATLEPFTDKPSKDYTPFITFSDGARAVFTGQFLVGEPESGEASSFEFGANNDNTRWIDVTRIKLDPGSFGRMIAGSEIRESPTVLPLVEGEYVYFGQATVNETPALISVTDSAAPDWLREHLYASMAATFEYFERRLGPLPGGKPFMLTTFESLEGGQLSFTGGVIGTQLAIELGLGEEIQDTPAERQFMARFFAHESAHLWNNGRVFSPNGDEAWMHEGGAEAKAWLALNAMGQIDDDQLLSLFNRSANACAKYLADGPLKQAGQRDAFRAFYDCGAIMALATHGMMQASDRDLFDFWRQMIKEAEFSDGMYRQPDYLALVAAQSPELAGKLQTMATEDLTDPGLAITGLLATAGFEIVTGPENEIEILSLDL